MLPQPQPTLSGERLLLRALTLADAAVVQSLAGDARVAATAHHIPHPYPDGAAENWIGSTQAQYAHGMAATFAITLRASHELIGAISLRLDAEQGRAEMGYWVGTPYWSQGYASEAGRAMLGFAFKTLHLRRVFARYIGSNPASGRVMQKMGMTLEGCMRAHEVVQGSVEDMLFYGILKADWEAAHEQTG